MRHGRSAEAVRRHPGRRRPDEDAVIAFIKQFLTGPTFFPRLGKQVSSYAAEEAILDEIGRELHKVLTEVMPAPQAGKESDLVATSYLRIELPHDDVAAITARPDTERLALVATALAERGFVVESELARSLFAIKVDASTTLGRIRDAWTSEFPDSAPLWFDSIVRQAKLAITDNYPNDVPWAPYRTSVERSYIPVVSRSRAMPSGGMQFDLYFVAIGPAPVPVSTRMIPIDNAFHKRNGTTSASAILLGDLVAEMDEEGRSRVPVLAEDGGVKYIVHRSMIDQFVAQQAMSGNDVKELSLEQLLEDAHFATIFADSFRHRAAEHHDGGGKGEDGRDEQCTRRARHRRRDSGDTGSRMADEHDVRVIEPSARPTG